MIYLREEEFVIWQIYGPIKCDSDRRDWDFDMDRSEREAWDIGWSIRDHCEHVVEDFSLFRQDVASIKKFAHPCTSRNLRKTEVETVQNSIKKLLSLINGKLTIYQGRQRGTQADVNHF